MWRCLCETTASMTVFDVGCCCCQSCRLASTRYSLKALDGGLVSKDSGNAGEESGSLLGFNQSCQSLSLSSVLAFSSLPRFCCPI